MDFLRGTCPVPNWVFDKLMWLLTGEELKIVMFVIRRTRGFQRDAERITRVQMVEGTRAEDGALLDHGTGLGWAAVKRLLPSLKRLGVLAELAPNNPLNEGPEFRLGREEEVDWEALRARRERRQDVAAEACAAARERKGGVCQTTLPPVCSTDPPGGLSDNPTPGLSDNPTPGLSNRPPLTKERKPEETQRENQEVGGGDSARESGDPAECRRLLESIGVSEPLIEYLTRDPERCHWAAQWATWWPCRAAAVGEGQVNAFISGRVQGAVRGNEEDRTPPREWWDFEAARVKRKRQQEAAAKRTAQKKQAAAVKVGDGAEPLFQALLGAVGDILRGNLECADSVELVDGALVLRFSRSGNYALLDRQRLTVLARVREQIPTFPEVRFELVKEARRG